MNENAHNLTATEPPLPLQKANEAADTTKIRQLDDEYALRKAFEQDAAVGCALLFEQYHQALCSHVVRFVYSKEIAEDIVGDVFCRFWKNKAYEAVKTSYRMYLFRSVRNEAISYLRAEFKAIEGLEMAENTEGSVSYQPDYIAQFEEISKKLKDIVEGLPPQCRKVFLLNRFEGKRYQAIAEELSLSVKTVEAHISLALQRIKKGLVDYI